MTHVTRTTCLLACLASVATSLVACAADRDAAGARFDPGDDRVFTVATAVLPSPGFWEGDGSGGFEGFEAGIADELAARLDLGEVEVVQIPFRRIVAGDLGSADVALSQATPTSEREEAVDFSIAYITTTPGVLARAGVESRDAQDLQGLRWLVTYPSTLSTIVTDRIRPDEDPVEVEDRDAAIAALLSGSGDAYLLDLPVALGIARSEPDDLTVLGQLSGREGLAVVLPDGSDNREVVDSTLRAMRADGTIDDLSDRWLGGSGSDVPLIRVAD